MPDIDARIRDLLGERLAPAREAATERVPSGVVRALIALLMALDRLLARWRGRLVKAAAAGTRGALRQELADHLRDAYERQIELGRDPEAAWEHVRQRFGDYEAILGELEALHQPVPLWEIVSRLLALPAALLCFMPLTGLSLKDIIQPTVWIVMFAAAPLAAWNSRDWGWPAWLGGAARCAGFALLCWVAWIEGISLIACLVGVMVAAVVAVVLRTFRPGRFCTRLREVIIIFMLVSVGLGFYVVSMNVDKPEDTGKGIATVFIFVLYGVPLARPRLPVLVLVTACCHAAVWIALCAMASAELAKTGAMVDGFFKLWGSTSCWYFYRPVVCTGVGLLAVWTIGGRRNPGRSFGAAGVVGMILCYIAYLKNLDRAEELPGMVVAVSLPLLLWLAPAAGWVLRKCGVGGGVGE